MIKLSGLWLATKVEVVDVRASDQADREDSPRGRGVTNWDDKGDFCGASIIVLRRVPTELPSEVTGLAAGSGGSG